MALNLKNKFKLSDIDIPSKLNLYDYQQDIINKIHEKIADGENAIFVQSSPGSGKTLMMSELVREYSQKYNVLSIAHRQEIIRQTIGRYIAQGANYDNILVAMVQTATRHLKDIKKPKLIIIDEAHHSMASSYLNLLKHFNDKDIIKVYFSATPWRADGKGFTSLVPAKNLICGPTTDWLIEHNFLAPYKYYQPKLINDNLLKFSGRSGDFTNKSVQNAAKSIDPIKLVNWYQKLGKDRQGIVYAASIESSQAIVNEFNKKGIPAFHLDGASDKEERDKIIEKYRQGKIKILSNVEIFTEGLDLPNAAVALIARPTMSLALYLQFSMRVLRYKKDKEALILDFAGNAARLGLPSQDFQWSLRPHDIKKKYVVGIIQCPHCQRIFNKRELIVDFHDATQEHKAFLQTICPHCQETIKVQEVDSEDKADTAEFNKLAKDYLEDNQITNISNRKAFENYWLASQEFDTATTLVLNYRIARAKDDLNYKGLKQSPKQLITNVIQYFYDNILNVDFDNNEVNKLIDFVNKHDDKSFNRKAFDDISVQVKKDTEEEQYLDTNISFGNPLPLNIKISKIQGKSFNQPYYKILFDNLASDNRNLFISLNLTKDLLEDHNAADYYKSLRLQVSNAILRDCQYQLLDAQFVIYKTGNRGIILKFKKSYVTNKFMNNTRNYYLNAFKANHNKLTTYSAKDIATILYGNKYTVDQMKEIQTTDFNQLVFKMKQHINETFLIIKYDGTSEKLVKI